MHIIKDLINVITGLSIVDYILYFSVLALIILIASLIYIMKNESEEPEDTKEIGSDYMNYDNTELDLQAIADTIDENPTPSIDMTKYEQEQESKAIISYDELINGVNNRGLDYEKEELIDNCIPAKKINLTNLITEVGAREPKEPVDITKDEPLKKNVLFHYEKEEAFLKALKELNELLN